VPGKRIEFQYGEQAPIIREFNRISAREKRERFLALYDALKGLVDGLDDCWQTLPEGKAATKKANEALACAEGSVIAK